MIVKNDVVEIEKLTMYLAVVMYVFSESFRIYNNSLFGWMITKYIMIVMVSIILLGFVLSFITSSRMSKETKKEITQLTNPNK